MFLGSAMCLLSSAFSLQLHGLLHFENAFLHEKDTAMLFPLRILQDKDIWIPFRFDIWKAEFSFGLIYTSSCMKKVLAAQFLPSSQRINSNSLSCCDLHLFFKNSLHIMEMIKFWGSIFEPVNKTVLIKIQKQ